MICRFKIIDRFELKRSIFLWQGPRTKKCSGGPKVKLYDTPSAPNPRRVRWVMAEKGITDIEIVPVNILIGAHREESFKLKTGLAHVPALEFDDGTTISESIAIARYLEALYPEPNLFGRTPREVAEIEMWLRRAEIYVANPLMLHVRHTHPALAALDTQKPELAALYKGMAEAFMKPLDRQLEGRDFIVADRLTMADIVLCVGLDFTRLARYRIPDAFGNIKAWYEKIRTRPAAKAGMDEITLVSAS